MVDLCSEIREAVTSAAYVGLPGAGGADAIFIIFQRETEYELQDQLLQIQQQLDSLELKMAVLPVNSISIEPEAKTAIQFQVLK